MRRDIAIVGIACRYPDANSPQELWENVLAQRQAFRRLPEQRLRLADYYSPDHSVPDATYSTQAAVLEGYEFDRSSFRIGASAYQSTDLAHWLALQVAAEALTDAGFPGGEGLSLESTGVIIGNTLTGEMTRAQTLRLRWPYVRRVLAQVADDEGLDQALLQRLLERFEPAFKQPFAPVNEETLAGSLSNTIAGRIANYFDFGGGGYTVDAACASSLLAVSTACSHLAAGDLDAAIAGGVDISLDPFELIGFAKTEALATDEMRVYDAKSSGFWPGEGCGCVILMRHADAVAQGRRVYAVIKGWGISSDGKGGLTRPDAEGQLLAVRRAYARAGWGIDSVGYIEGHGTGTAVGDATELRVLTMARREAGAVTTAAIGSVKGNIGHTKAAAGIAGLIKATLALHRQMLPPTTGCYEPHATLHEDEPMLRVESEGRPWPADQPLRAAICAMGFGGINTHVALEGVQLREPTLAPHERLLGSTAQDTELFLFGGDSALALRQQIAMVRGYADRLSRSEMTDLSVELARRVRSQRARAAVVASRPGELSARLATLEQWLADGIERKLHTEGGVFLGGGSGPPKIVYLFPGQGSPVRLGWGIWARRFPGAPDAYDIAASSAIADITSTAVAQPAVVAASLAGLDVLDRCGIEATVAVGHSLGELSALCWAGALTKPAVAELAKQRGKAMAEYGESNGAMASLGAAAEDVQPLLHSGLVIAGYNSARQTVVAGPVKEIEALIEHAGSLAIRAVRLHVTRAFHSPLVAESVEAFDRVLAATCFTDLQRPVSSTVTGGLLARDHDLPTLLKDQITNPVRFIGALTHAASSADLLIEVGPGGVLTGLSGEITNTPAISLDVGGPSFKGLLSALGATYCAGAAINLSVLTRERFSRPFDLDWQPRFITNPCETVATDTPAATQVSRTASAGHEVADAASADGAGTAAPTAMSSATSARACFVAILQEETLLPTETLHDGVNLQTDLHLSSLTVTRLVVRTTQQMGMRAPRDASSYAVATVGMVIEALEGLQATVGNGEVVEDEAPAGVDSWVRAFAVGMVEAERPASSRLPFERPWRVVTDVSNQIATAFGHALPACGGGGVLVILEPGHSERNIALLLEAAACVQTDQEPAVFAVLQSGGGGAAFAKTLHLERPGLATCVVDVPEGGQDVVQLVCAEIAAASGYTEAHYGRDGLRRVPEMMLLPAHSLIGSSQALTRDDVLLVSGGGKGIAAESALQIARESGVQLALLGRSDPQQDAELSANLKRLAAAGVAFRYLITDITDAPAVATAVRTIEQQLGVVTAVLHGAGVNTPQLISSLDAECFRRTAAPKVTGARNVLQAVDATKLKHFVAFGSVIARTGMRGEADYAVANEWLGRELDQYQQEYPGCRFVNLEWSVWSGVGMGERLGRIEALTSQGVTPITPDQGVEWAKRAFTTAWPFTSVLVTSRFGVTQTLHLERPALPFLRFLEKPRVWYPGVELVVDVQLSTSTDPYLDDHVYAGERLLPAVAALEAFAQVAQAAAGSSEPTREFSAVSLSRPVIIPPDRPLLVRVAALVREDGDVEVVLRSEETSFQVDHFRAVCRTDAGQPAERLPVAEKGRSMLAMEPDKDLYGALLFHTGRFRRIAGYESLDAWSCTALISPAPPEQPGWFARHIPGELQLPDPAARDAFIHGIQACIPHHTLLPVGVESVRLFDGGPFAGPFTMHAAERSRDGLSFDYDLDVTDEAGNLVEQWRGLRLKAVGKPCLPESWSPSLFVPYVQRRLEELLDGARVEIAFGDTEPDALDRTREIADRLPSLAGTSLLRRPDGKPELAGHDAPYLSASHAGSSTIVVTSTVPVTCDLQEVRATPAGDWAGLLPQESLALANKLAVDAGEDLATAASRMWSVVECLKKAGASRTTPLVIEAVSSDGWASLGAPRLRIASYIGRVAGHDVPVSLAVLVGAGRESL